MSKQAEALKMAIEVLKDKCGYADEPCEKAIQACKDALAETEKDESCSTKQN